MNKLCFALGWLLAALLPGAVRAQTDLTVTSANSPYAISGTYHNVTVNPGGTLNLSGDLTITGQLYLYGYATLNTGTSRVVGPGSFFNADNSTLSTGNANGIGFNGSTGSIQVTGGCRFDPVATYLYNGTQPQTTGSGLASSVNVLQLNNSAGLQLSQSLTIWSAATLTAGVLYATRYQFFMGSGAQLTETATGYVLGEAYYQGQPTTSTTNFSGIGITLTNNGSSSLGTIVVHRSTGPQSAAQIGSKPGVKRNFYLGSDTKNALNVDLSFTFRADELNGIDPAQLRLYSQANNPSNAPWQQQAATITATPASGTQPATYTATIRGVTSLAADWTLGVAPTPMPVELVDFTAQAQGTATLLRWTTASEIHNDRFEVEGSLDGTHFTQLGTVPGQGSSAQVHHYAFTDDDLARSTPPATRYYRLRQVDTDGTATYSPVRMVAGLATTGPQLYPNPATTLVHLLGADPTQPLRLLDAQGQVLREWAAGTTSFEVQGLPQGLYLLQAGARAQRLTVQ